MNAKTKLILYSLIFLVSLGFVHHAKAFVCEDNITFNYKGTQVTYDTVTVGSQCWMDRNLGASQVATGPTDSASYGDYFQWGRLDDGHQTVGGGTSPTLSSATIPGHNKFIKATSTPYNWLSTRSTALWDSSAAYVNNPCPTGWHVPSYTEWSTAMTTSNLASCSSDCLNSLANSTLRISAAGSRNYTSGAYTNFDMAYYWTSTSYTSTNDSANNLYFDDTSVSVDGTNYRAYGYPVRCIAETSAATPNTYTLGTSSSQTINVHNDLTVGDGTNTTNVTANANNPTLNVTGNVAIMANAGLTAPSSSSFSVGGNWTNGGNFTVNSGTLVFNGTYPQTFATNGQAFNNITLNNTGADGANDNVTITGNLDVNGNLNITNGDLYLTTSNPSVNVAGSFSIGSSAFVTKGSGTTTFDGTTVYTDSSSGGPQNIGTVALAGTSTTLASSMTADKVTVIGTLDLASSGYTLTLAGSGTGTSRPLYINGGTLNEGTNSTIKYTGTTASEIEAETYNNLELKPNGGSTPTYTLLGGAVAGGTQPVNGTPQVIGDSSDLALTDYPSRQIMRTSSGTLYAVLMDNESGTYKLEVWRSTDGTSWTQQDSGNSPILSKSITGDLDFAVAMDGSDFLQIAYQGYYVKFNTATNTFGASEQFFDLTSCGYFGCFVFDTAIAIDSNNKPHVVMYLYDNDSYSAVDYFNKVGANWTSPYKVEEYITYTQLDISIDQQNIPEIYEGSGVNRAWIGNQNNATSFTVKALANGTDNSIAVDPSGNTWVAYAAAGTNYITLAKHPTGTNWTDPWYTYTNSNVGSTPVVAVTGTKVYVLYEDENHDIVYDYYDVGSWHGEIVLATGTYQTPSAKWSFNYNNKGYLYLDYLYSDGTDVYYNTLTLPNTPTNGTPNKIGDSSDLNSGDSIFRTSGGTIYSVVIDDESATKKAEVWNSSAGTSWSQQNASSSPTVSSYSTIYDAAIDGSNNIHIVYLDSTDYNVNYVIFNTTTNTFGTPETIYSSPTFSPSGISIAVDSNNKPHVTYDVYDNFGDITHLGYANKVGASWSSVDAYASWYQSSIVSDITINEDNIPEIIYSNTVNSTVSAIVGDANNAATFTAPYDIDASTNLDFVSIAVDSSGNTWGAYADAITGYITLAKHPDSQSDWTSDWTTTSHNDSGTAPKIAINGNDVYVFYRDENADIVYNKYNGSWGIETSLAVGTYGMNTAKWSFCHNNGDTERIDYIYSDSTDVYYNNLIFTTSSGGGGTITTQNLTIGDGTNGVLVRADTNNPALDVNGNLSIATSGSLTASSSAGFSVAGGWTNSGVFTNSSGVITFDSTDAGETINTGGTGAGKTFYDVVFNNSGGGWTIQTNDMKATHNFTITDVSSWTLASGRTLEVGGTYAIADAETSATTWTGSTFYINGTSQTIGSSSQAEELYGTLHIGTDDDVRMWQSSAASFTIDSGASLYSMDHDANNGELDILGDYHTNSTDYWNYNDDFDGTDISGTPRDCSVKLASSAVVTVDAGETLEAVGVSGHVTTVDWISSSGYNIVNYTGSPGGTIDFQYASFDHLKGNKGIDIQSGSVVTSLDYTSFDNLVDSDPTDAYIYVDTAVIETGNKTITGVNFGNTGGANFNVNRSDSEDSSFYWDFDAHTGSLAGEAYDGENGSDEADPGMLKWDNLIQGITISGTIWTDEGKTVPITDGRIVHLFVNTTDYSTTPTAGGAYSFSAVTVAADDSVIAYLDGVAEDGSTVTLALDSTTAIDNLDIITGHISLEHRPVGPISNTDLDDIDTVDAGNEDGITINSGNAEFADGFELYILSGENYTPSGTVTCDDFETEGTGTFAPGANAVTVSGDWEMSATGTFTTSGTVTFNGTVPGLTITDGGSPFYDLVFSGASGEWLYKDGASTAPNSTSVSNGTPTFLNAKTGTVLVTGGTLNQDWYLGIHAVNAAETSTNIDTGDADITISETGSNATVWRNSGSNWGTASASQTTGTGLDGKNPQPETAGSIRIREYSMTASATCPGAGCTLYRYNNQIDWVGSYGEYDYYDDYGNKYITSALASGSDDNIVGVNWYRSSSGTMNSEPTINEPPTNGSWYVGMLEGLSFSIDSFSRDYGNLTPGSNPTDLTNNLTVATSASHGYVIYAREEQPMTCSNVDLCGTADIDDWSGTNEFPSTWSGGSFGFGYSTNDYDLPSGEGDADRFSGPKFAKFIDTGFGEPVADRTGPSSSQSNTVTYRIAPNGIQTAGTYQTSIIYIVAPTY